MSDEFGHVAVLASEVVDLLAPKPGGRYADLTLGAGGHAELILKATAPDGVLYGFDRDAVAIEIATNKLAPHGDRLRVTEANFAQAPKLLGKMGATDLDGALLDLGVSSMQLDDADRGFSFIGDGRLDMRMSKSIKKDASDLVAETSVADLEKIFTDFGEEPRAKAIAIKIAQVRKRSPITRTRELAELVRAVTGGGGRIHPATRVFQALRIAVNGELDELEQVLPALLECLKPGGRLAVISFHSLEDRIVKTRFRDEKREGRGRVLTKRPVVADEVETRTNPRSRSAKLRVFERE